MSEEKYEIHHGGLYNYTAGVFAGVLVDEKTMKKLAKLQAQHLESVKRLLANAADEGRVHSSSWTLHYPDGKQTEVRYIDGSVSVAERIKTATTLETPIYVPLAFKASSMAEAAAMADAHYEATHLAEA